MSQAAFQQGVPNVTTSIQQTHISIITFVKKEMMHTTMHQVQSHLLSLLELGSGILQEASWLIFDMFSEYQLQRPTTASSASLTPFYVVNP